MFDPKKLGEEADQMIQQLNQTQGDAPPAEEQPAGAEAIAQEVVNAQSDDQGVQPGPAVPAATEPPAEQAAPTVELDLLRKQIEAAEQKWRVLQGMINKKDEEIEAMRQLFASLNAKPQPAAAESLPDAVVSARDIKEYGQDLVDFVQRVTRASLSEVRAQLTRDLEARFGKLEGSMQHVEQTTARTAQERFYDALTTEMPDWRAMNVDPAFLGWLELSDAFAGVPRMQLLRDAVASHDAHRASAFFAAYKREAAPAPTAEVPTPAPAPVKNLERLVAPGKAKPVTPKAEGTKRTWTRADIARLYDDKMSGRISAHEFAEAERDMFAAQRDGRIAA